MAEEAGDVAKKVIEVHIEEQDFTLVTGCRVTEACWISLENGAETGEIHVAGQHEEENVATFRCIICFTVSFSLYTLYDS